MNRELRNQTDILIRSVLDDIRIDNVVRRELENYSYPKGKTIILAIGKAAYDMALAASEVVKTDEGYILTKYGHSKGKIDNFEIFEASHPLTDINGILASEKIVERLSDLDPDDEVILLLSGGGSALFEIPLIPMEDIRKINEQLLSKGCSIDEINTIRKRLSKVKGGRLAKIIEPAHIRMIVISDVVSDRLDVIASGPAWKDDSNSKEALGIIERYEIDIDDKTRELLKVETPKECDNVEARIISGVKDLARAAEKAARKLGYETILVSDRLEMDVEEAGKLLMEIAHKQRNNTAIIAAGETTVRIKGNGLGGRNQHLALYCAQFIKDEDMCVISLGSDGTDGPTDAAGGYTDGDTLSELENYHEYLDNCDSYHALLQTGGLLITGPTGTNINDMIVILKK